MGEKTMNPTLLSESFRAQNDPPKCLSPKTNNFHVLEPLDRLGNIHFSIFFIKMLNLFQDKIFSHLQFFLKG